MTAGRDYELPERHDPIYLMFDNDFHLGRNYYGWSCGFVWCICMSAAVLL